MSCLEPLFCEDINSVLWINTSHSHKNKKLDHLNVSEDSEKGGNKMNKVVSEQKQASIGMAKARKEERSGALWQNQGPCTWLIPALG